MGLTNFVAYRFRMFCKFGNIKTVKNYVKNISVTRVRGYNLVIY